MIKIFQNSINFFLFVSKVIPELLHKMMWKKEKLKANCNAFVCRQKERDTWKGNAWYVSKRDASQNEHLYLFPKQNISQRGVKAWNKDYCPVFYIFVPIGDSLHMTLATVIISDGANLILNDIDFWNFLFMLVKATFCFLFRQITVLWQENHEFFLLL